MLLSLYVIFLILSLIISLIFDKDEIKKWNKGVCIKNNIPWQFVDTYKGIRKYQAGSEILIIGMWNVK